MTPEQELELMRLRARAKPANKFSLMSQVNRGIADTVGGAVDLLNPFERYTGSAADGLRNAMESAGIEVANDQPQGVMQGAARGLGNAAGALIPGASLLRAIGAFGGAVGAAGQDAFAALMSRGGAALEGASGAAAGAAETATREAGGGPLAQMGAGLAAGAVAPAAVLSAPDAAKAIAMAAPISGRLIRGAQAALTPYTQEGAMNVARNRLQSLAGGQERAAQLAGRIDPTSRLTPAQQTEDPAFLGLERAAGEADPALGDRLAERTRKNIDAIKGEVAAFGDGRSIADTRAAVEMRRRAFQDNLASRVTAARQRASERMASLSPERSETDNSLIVAEEIRKSFREAQEIENNLWRNVPESATVPTASSRQAVESIIAKTPRSQEQDIPRSALRFLGRDGEYGDAETVNEMHGLYSALREEARNAMAGTSQNRNRARIANEIAESILKDLGTTDPTSEVGNAINIAREFSAQVHQTFDQGTVGKLLRRTVNSDEQIPPELTLDRTVSRGGAAGDTAFADINRAVGATNDLDADLRGAVEDYLRRRFSDAAFLADGQFSERGARTFMRNNLQLLDRFPDLRSQFARATGNRAAADAMAGRVSARVVAAENPRQSMGARFVKSPEGREIETILSARNPAQAAREVVRQARGDRSGAALSGLKGAFARHLIDRATPGEGVRSVTMREMLRDPRTVSAMREIYNALETSRIWRIADELAKIESPRRAIDVGGVSNVKPPTLISLIARTFAARQGARAGAGTSGASLLTANFASKRMQEIISGLTNDRAARIIGDAIENPELFRALLTDPASKAQSQRALRSLAPYVIGATSASQEE